MKRYKMMQIEEREEIMKEVVEAKNFQEIASKINRNVSNISREIKRKKKDIKSNKDLKQAQYGSSKA